MFWYLDFLLAKDLYYSVKYLQVRHIEGDAGAETVQIFSSLEI